MQEYGPAIAKDRTDRPEFGRVKRMSGSGSNSTRYCTFQQYTLAWEVGTGLRVALKPGSYRITGEEQLNGIHFVRLDERYRIEASQLSE